MEINKLSQKSIPERLQRIASPPKQLFVSGQLDELLALPMVGIVGSRKVSPYGRSVTTRLAGELAGQGIVIVSGLAFGVDSIAHQAALDAGGRTIAVLPSPLETIYPASHRQLAANILKQGGALISEYPAGTESFRGNFVARNRIISGLSNALLVTEAAEKSGSLHTARFALEQGKDVLAVPGNINSPTSVGTNNLLRAGAGVATCADDILYALKLSPEQLKPVKAASEPEQIILDLIAAGTADGDKLAQDSQLEIALFNQTLTMLEITGKIRPLGANQWALS